MRESKIAGYLKLAYRPVAVIFANDKPDGATQFKEGTPWGCLVALLTAAAKGKTAVIGRETCPCGGGRVGLGFQDGYNMDIPGGIDYFLSTGRGEGYREGEFYRKTPERAREFVEALPTRDIPFTCVVFKLLDEVDEERETPQEVVLYANPDQLAALVVLANYDRPAGEHVIIPFAAGCQSIGIIPYREAECEYPRAVVGMMDVSARLMVPSDTVSFTVPYAMYRQMEADADGSFLSHEAWQKVRARIP